MQTVYCQRCKRELSCPRYAALLSVPQTFNVTETRELSKVRCAVFRIHCASATRNARDATLTDTPNDSADHPMSLNSEEANTHTVCRFSHFEQATTNQILCAVPPWCRSLCIVVQRIRSNCAARNAPTMIVSLLIRPQMSLLLSL